jgi:hypothetical protein
MTMRIETRMLWLLLLSAPVAAQDDDTSRDLDAELPEFTEVAAESEPIGDGIASPRSMSGMSILGNEEAPKALVIIPWKSSELGDDISLSDTLDERAQPVDRDVFMRELSFHKIRSGE